MILVDYRTGSRELLQMIRSMGVDAELTELAAGDFAFSGNGDPVQCAAPFIGFERKSMVDFIASMRTQRLAGFQVVRMNRIYDECYLIIEGVWRRGNQNGCIELPSRSTGWYVAQGHVKYTELDRYLCSLEIQGGIRLWRTQDGVETAAAVVDRYLWWQKPWEEHRAMQAIYTPEGTPVRRGHRPQTLRHESTLAEKVASQLPGIDSRAVTVAAYFGSVFNMARATEAEWMEVPGVGRTTARKIVWAIQNRKENETNESE